MALRTETAELLSGFEHRMKFIAIVRCLTEYSCPQKISDMIPDRRILDNLILAVLVYIKDKTLGYDQRCTLSDIARFLEELLPLLPENCHVDPEELSRYIVVKIFQNDGVVKEFTTYDSTSETFQKILVRLVNEENGAYHLTDDAYDFLFRSKEIESELDYSIARFRLKEYMNRDNYENALEASRELIARIRGMKMSMDDFLTRCREDFSKITVDQYETMIQRIRSLLDTEEKELTEVQNLALEKERLLMQAQSSGLGRDEIYRHRRAVKEIIENITCTISEQRELILKRSSFSDTYKQILRDRFVSGRFERLHFERDIMAPLRKSGNLLGDAVKFFLFPLTKPELPNMFSVESFYVPMDRRAREEEQDGFEIETEEDESEPENLAEIRNERFLHICRDFFQFATGKDRFFVSEFVGSLPLQALVAYSEENALPRVFLSVYELQEISIDTWKKGERFSVPPNGEFELSWCLENLSEELLDMKEIRFSHARTEFSFSVKMGEIERTFDMTDFTVEVIR